MEVEFNEDIRLLQTYGNYFHHFATVATLPNREF
jgi:hypothetical protein